MEIYTGLDLSRNRLDWHALSIDGALVDAGAVPPDADGLAAGSSTGRCERARRLGGDERCPLCPRPARASRPDVRLADPHRSRALAPLACKTDRIDAWVWAELARRDLIPEVWLPDPGRARAERERARFRIHLVKHRTMLKNRIHQKLIAHGHPRPHVGLFTQQGRSLLDRLELPEPWRERLQASLTLIETLDQQIDELERELRQLGANHRDVPCSAQSPASPGCWRTRSPPRSATSPDSPARAS
jgi:transposase